MKKITFSDLSIEQMGLVNYLATIADVTTQTVLASVTHIGELREAQAFLHEYPFGTLQSSQFIGRLRLGGNCAEPILETIGRIAPEYVTLGAELCRFMEGLSEPIEPIE